MVIVARGGATYARLAFTAGPGGSVVVPVQVDWERLPQDLLEHEGRLDTLVCSWFDEYCVNVHPYRSPATLMDLETIGCSSGRHSPPDPLDLDLSELDELHDRQFTGIPISHHEQLDEWDRLMAVLEEDQDPLEQEQEHPRRQLQEPRQTRPNRRKPKLQEALRDQ